MLVGQTEPLAPIAITADKVAQYESQYVKIENTQPEASESGTWNSDSNKGNVSMETKDGKSYKIRTLQTASYAQDAIPTDKSGSIAGIAGIYNGTLQSCPATVTTSSLPKLVSRYRATRLRWPKCSKPAPARHSKSRA